MSGMQTDVIKMLKDTLDLMKEVIVNKKYCTRLESKMNDMLVAVKYLQNNSMKLSPVVYHQLISILLDVKAFFKKSSVKTLLGNFQKSKIQSEFDSLNQRLTNVMMDEPRLLPPNAIADVSHAQSLPGERKKTGRTMARSNPGSSTSSYCFEDSIEFSSLLNFDQLSRWFLECVSLPDGVVSTYTSICLSNSLTSLMALHQIAGSRPKVLVDLGFAEKHAKAIVQAVERAIERKSSRVLSEDDMLPTYEMALYDETVSTSTGDEKQDPSRGINSLKRTSHSSRQLLASTVESSMKCLTDALTQNDEVLAVAALSSVADMTEGSEENQRAYGAAGACDVVVFLVIEMCWSEAVCEVGLRTICWLSRHGTARHTSSQENIAAMGLAGACRAVVAAMDTHEDNEDVLFWGCRAIMNLSSNIQNNTRLGEDGACVTVIRTLALHRKQTETHEKWTDGGDFSLQIWGALINISLTPANNAKLAEADAARVIVDVWQERQSTRNIALWACMATQNLALNDTSKVILGLCGCGTLVVEALRMFSTDTEVVAQGFMAIQNLANNHHDNNTRLGDAGACEVVIEVLRIHVNDEAVAQRGCMALMNLSYDHQHNKERLVRHGVGQILADSLSLHPDNASVSEFAFGAIVNLTDADWETTPLTMQDGALDVIAEMEMAGVCDKVVSVLRTHCEDTNCEVVAELGCWAIRNLCYRSLDNKTVMGALGAADAVCLSLSTHMGSVAVSEMACWAIRVLADGNQQNSYRLGTVGACADLLRLLQLQYSVTSVVELGCLAIQSLALSCDRNRRLLADLDAYAIVMKAVKDHYANEHIETLGLRTLSCLTRQDDQDGSGEEDEEVDRDAADASSKRDGVEEVAIATNVAATLKIGRVESTNKHANHMSTEDDSDNDIDEDNMSGSQPEDVRRTFSVDSDVVRGAELLGGRNIEGSCTPSLSGSSWDDRILGLSAEVDVDVDEALSILRNAAKPHQSEIYCAAALALVARLAEGRGGVLQKLLGQGGACELIAVVMTPMLHSEKVCRYALEAICWMSRYGSGKETSNEGNVEALGLAGICEAVVTAGLSHHTNDVTRGSELCLWCCRAITNLASNERNSFKLGSCGACQVVLNILRGHYEIVMSRTDSGGYSGSGNLMDVVKQGWGAVINLALVEENNTKFGDEGGCQCIANYLMIWNQTPPGILMFLLIGVQNLALLECNREILTHTKISTYIVNIVEVYIKRIGTSDGVESILEYACMAIQKLALSRSHSDCIGQIGGCKSMVNILHCLPDHLGIQELGCLAVMNLSSESESNAALLISSDVYTCLNQAISNFTDVTGGEPVVEYSLTALNNIARVCSSEARVAMTVACIEKVVVAVKVCYRRAKGTSFPINVSIIEQACSLMTKLVSEEACKQLAMACGAKSVLSKIIRGFQDEDRNIAGIARSALKALLRTSHSVEKSSERASKSMVENVVVSSQEEEDDAVLADLDIEKQFSQMISPRLPPPNDCLSISSVDLRDESVCSDDISDENISVELSVPEAVEALRRALEKKANNEFAVASCLLRVSGLAEGNAARQSELGAVGACEVVVRALDAYTFSELVCENGLRAVCFLSRHGQDKVTANESNNAAFGNLQVAKILVHAMNVHRNSDKVCFFGCKAIMNLGSEDTHNAKLGESGACEAVVSAIESFFEVDNVLKQGLWALINLALNEHNNKRFHDIGCSVVLSVLKRCGHQDDLTSWALMAIQNLSIRKENRIHLGELGACELVTAAINTHKNYSPVIEYGCMATEKLALEASNSARAGKAGACEAVIAAISRHSENDMISELGWKAVHRLARENFYNCRRFADAGVANLVVESFRIFQDDEDIMEQVLVALSTLAAEPRPSLDTDHHNFTNGTKSILLQLHDDEIVNTPLSCLLGRVGVCKLVVQMLTRYTSEEAISLARQGKSDNIGIIYLLLSAMAALATDCPENRQIFGEEGGCEKTIAAITLHLGSEDIAAKGCAVVLALSTANKVNALRFSSTGAETVIFRVIQKNNLSKKVIGMGFSALTTVFGIVAEDATSCAAGDVKRSQRSRRKSGISDNTASFEIVIKILNIHQQSKHVTVGGCQLLHALIVASVAVGSGEILADMLPGTGAGKVIKLSPNSFLGIAQALVRSINLFPNSARVCRLVCMTMGEVAVELTCSSVLGSLNACESIVSCLKRYTDLERSARDLHADSSIRHASDDSNNIAVVRYALRAIYCLAAEVSNIERLLACHVAPNIVSTLRCFSKSESVVKAGCLTMVALAREQQHRQEIMNCGGHECIVLSLKTFHINSLVVEYGLVVISKLLLDSENAGRIGDSKTCRLIVSLLKHYQNYFQIAKLCCSIIMSLCSDTHCQNNLGSARASEELLRVFQQYANDEDMAELCCKAITLLGPANKSICTIDNTTHDERCGNVMLDVMVANADNKTLVSNSLCVVKDLVDIFPEVFLHFHQGGVPIEGCAHSSLFFHTLLVTLVEKYLHDLSIVESIMLLVKNFMLNCPDDIRLLCVGSSIGSNGENEATDYGESSISLKNVVATITSYIDNNEVVENCLGILDAICAVAVECRIEHAVWRSFEFEGMCQCILGVCLERYMVSLSHVLLCCRIVKNLAIIAQSSGGESRILRDLSSLGASDILLRVLRIFRNNEDNIAVCAECCGALDELCEIGASDRSLIGRKGFCACAIEMLRKYSGVARDENGHFVVINATAIADTRKRLIVGALCKSLSVLVCAEENRAKLDELGICDLVGPLLLAYKFDSFIAERCCQVVLNMASEEGTTIYLGRANVCEGVVLALINHLAEATVVKCASWACMNLSVEDENKSFLHSAGACRPLLDVLSKYSEVADIVEVALGAVVNLADRNDENKSALCAGGIIDIAMRFLRGAISTTVLELTFMLIVNLTDDVHKESIIAFTNSELFSLVLKHMQQSDTNTVLVEQGCWIVKNLCCNNIENAAEWGRLGACDVVLNGLRVHFVDTASVAVQGCAAIASLLGMDNHGSLTKRNIELLTANGAFGTLTLAMSIHRTDEEVVESCCVAISRLLSFFSNEETEYVEEHLDRINFIHESITEVLLSHFVNEVVSERCCQILSDIYSRDQCGFGKIRDLTGCCEGVVKALQTHHMLESVALESTLLMRLLSRHSKEAQRLIGLTGGCEKVVTTLQFYSHERSPRAAKLCVMCVDLIMALCKDDVAISAHMGACGACEIVVEAFQAAFAFREMARDSGVCGSGRVSIELIVSLCRCICDLSLVQVNKNIFLMGGAVAILSRVLSADSFSSTDASQLFPRQRALSIVGAEDSGDDEDDEDDVDECASPVVFCILCCRALLAVCGSEVDDITLFGGIDLPLALMRRILEIGPIESELTASNPRSAWNEFLGLVLRSVKTVLSMRHARRRHDLELHKNALDVLRIYSTKFPLVAAIFTEIVNEDTDSEGKSGIYALPSFGDILRDAVTHCEAFGGEYEHVVTKLSRLIAQHQHARGVKSVYDNDSNAR